MQQFVTQLRYCKFPHGTVILSKNEKAEAVYFIYSNTVYVTPRAKRENFEIQTTYRVAELKEQSFFGERSILFD